MDVIFIDFALYELATNHDISLVYTEYLDPNQCPTQYYYLLLFHCLLVHKFVQCYITPLKR